MATYARDVLRLTEEHPGISMSNSTPDMAELYQVDHTSVLKRRYFECNSDICDQRYIAFCCQIHKCNDLCMRTKRKRKRYVAL